MTGGRMSCSRLAPSCLSLPSYLPEVPGTSAKHLQVLGLWVQPFEPVKQILATSGVPWILWP